MKKRNNLRAAQQLEKLGKYSGAIALLEEFINLNPDYVDTNEVNRKIETLKIKLHNKGDTKFQFSFKPLLEIPGNIFRYIAGELLGYVLGLLLLIIIAGIIYIA